MANLGYVGLGVMGGRMVDRLMAKGHTVTGTNRTKSKAQWLIDPKSIAAEKRRAGKRLVKTSTHKRPGPHSSSTNVAG